ncbi:MAG: hypothetical protein GY893_05080 [bacterium]|nr:hypothetical protein [bacterium]
METVGALAVVVSLIYVAKQIRANTEQSISDRLCDNMMIGSASELGSIIVRGITGNVKLDDEEQARFIFFVSGWLRTMEQAHRQYKKGYLDKAIWNGYEAYLRTVIPSKLIQAYWQERHTIFNEDFRKMIDEMNTDLEPTNFGIGSGR